MEITLQTFPSEKDSSDPKFHELGLKMFNSTPTTALHHSKPPSHKHSWKSKKDREASQSLPKRGYLRLDSLEGTCETIPTKNNKQKIMDRDQLDAKRPPSKKESKWFSHYHQTDCPPQQPFQYPSMPPSATQISPEARGGSFKSTPQNQPPTLVHNNSWPTYQHSHYHHHHHHHQQQPQQFQTPYNLTKGQYELWQMTASMPNTPGPIALVELQKFQQDRMTGDHRRRGQARGGPQRVPGYYESISGIPASIGRRVSSFLEWGSAALYNAVFAYNVPNGEVLHAVESEECILRAQFYNGPEAGPPQQQQQQQQQQSNLNPNAPVFTPLNPNAKEFTPNQKEHNTSVSDVDEVCEVGEILEEPKVTEGHVNKCHSKRKDAILVSKSGPSEKIENSEDECVTPPLDINNEALRSVMQRKCTPWIGPSSPLRKPHSPCDDSDLISSPEGLGSMSDMDSDEEEEESDDDDDADVDISRARLYSQCSEDGAFIQFGSGSEAGSPPTASAKCFVKRKPSFDGAKSPVITENCSSFLKSFLAGQGDDADDSQEDDDSDWDSSGCADASGSVDEELLRECGIVCPWMDLTPTSKLKSTCDEIDSSRGGCEKSEFPSTHDVDREELLKIIADANVRWKTFYGQNGFTKKKTPKKSKNKSNKLKSNGVQFCEPLISDEFFEDPSMAEELRAARVDDKKRRDADKMRYTRILTPIFDPDHRAKVWNRLHSSDTPAAEAAKC